MGTTQALHKNTQQPVPITQESLQDWIVAFMAKEMKINPSQIAIDVEFSQYDFDSVVAMNLTGQLEDMLGRPLSPTLAYNYPTIESLAKHLVSQE